MINEFLTAPLPAQFLAAFILLFIFFWVLIEVKFFCLRLKKKGFALIKQGGVKQLQGYVYLVVAYVLFYGLAIFFVPADAAMNIIYMPMLYGERANKYGEGWLVTDRLKYHKHQPGWYWQKKVSLFICNRFVEKVDPGHCG